METLGREGHLAWKAVTKVGGLRQVPSSLGASEQCRALRATKSLWFVFAVHPHYSCVSFLVISLCSSCYDGNSFSPTETLVISHFSDQFCKCSREHAECLLSSQSSS